MGIDASAWLALLRNGCWQLQSEQRHIVDQHLHLVMTLSAPQKTIAVPQYLTNRLTSVRKLLQTVVITTQSLFQDWKNQYSP